VYRYGNGRGGCFRGAVNSFAKTGSLEMKKLLLAFLLCNATLSYAFDIAGVNLDDKYQLDAHQIVLNGAGIRTKFFFNVYVGALYLDKKASNDEAVLENSGAKRMSFHLLRDVTGKQVLEGINEAILPNNSIEETKALDSRMAEFSTMFKSVPEIKKGEVVNLDYIPGLGTRVTLNGVVKGSVQGLDFYRSLLKIWVGKKPVQSALKKSVLGGV